MKVGEQNVVHFSSKVLRFLHYFLIHCKMIIYIFFLMIFHIQCKLYLQKPLAKIWHPPDFKCMDHLKQIFSFELQNIIKFSSSVDNFAIRVIFCIQSTVGYLCHNQMLISLIFPPFCLKEKLKKFNFNTMSSFQFNTICIVGVSFPPSRIPKFINYII